MKKQTAVEWFYWQIMYADVDVKVWKEIHAQAIEMEKENSLDSFFAGFNYEGGHPIDQHEKFYIETFTELKND
jgi:hypothetical protein